LTTLFDSKQSLYNIFMSANSPQLHCSIEHKKKTYPLDDYERMRVATLSNKHYILMLPVAPITKI